MTMQLPQIENGNKTTLFITSDKKEFTNKEEAQWHEYSVCQLKQRRLTVDIPDHDIFHFQTREDLNHFFKENYGHLTYEVVSDLSHFTFPNDYVIMEEDAVIGQKTGYHVQVQSLENFKQAVIAQLVNS